MKRARCPFHQDAHSTNIPVPPTCPFHPPGQSQTTLPDSRFPIP
ncbi:hypothetical protein BJP36_40025 [Moorena producens JHB]|uniref:Uncharacterized protein n=1 Tax=Moorena producens (strain JHB) TaxID=1454205 RepID=A0A9Q9SS19_MOOP1|nr:hypothetical protein [Moorena producens]WAN68567.1 hypothetical protein BJP36_40025 [Moorena producens JHB]